MRMGLVSLVGVCAALAACSPDSDTTVKAEKAEASTHAGHHVTKLSEKAVKDKKEAAELLVGRFDVEACAKADLIGSLSRKDPAEGETIMRAYKVSVPCAEKATAAAKNTGFKENEPGIFAGASPNGTTESLKIQMIGDGAAATVEWEVMQE